MATIEIEAGKIYRASFATRGISPRGDWELVKVTDEKQRNDITIFPDNIPWTAVDRQIRISRFVCRKAQHEARI